LVYIAEDRLVDFKFRGFPLVFAEPIIAAPRFTQWSCFSFRSVQRSTLVCPPGIAWRIYTERWPTTACTAAVACQEGGGDGAPVTSGTIFFDTVADPGGVLSRVSRHPPFCLGAFFENNIF